MGSLLRCCRIVSVRVLPVPVLLALAWLVWGAGSAQASTDPSTAASSETALSPSLSAVPSLPAVQALPAGQDPAGAADHVVTAAEAGIVRAAPAVSTATRMTVPAAFPATLPAAPAVAAVSQASAPVASTVGHKVAAVDATVASAQRLPLTAVKLPQLRTPGVPVAIGSKTLPAVELAVLASPVPDAGRPVAKSPSGAVPWSRAAAASPPAGTSSHIPASEPLGIGSQAPAASNRAASQNVAVPFKTLAQLQMTASARPLVSAIQAPPQWLLYEHPATEPLTIYATHSESGSSSSGSSGSHAADIAAAWNWLAPAAGALAAGTSVPPPSGPAVGPGSSPG